MDEIEMLPLEVMGMILKRLSSPEDLASTIHASSCALAALQSDRRSIMATVICNDLSPEVLKEAVSILNCPLFESGDDYCSLWRRTSDLASGQPRDWKQKTSDFETWYFLDAPARFVLPRDMPISKIINLYRMRITINSLIADYVAHVDAMSVLDGPGPALYAPEKTNLACLTGCEINRIQIAFCRYELICRLAGLPYLQQSFDDQHPRIYSHWGQFLTHYCARTMEELGHVHNYVYSKYNLVFKEIDDDVTTLLSDDQEPVAECSYRPPTSVARQVLWEHDPDDLIYQGYPFSTHRRTDTEDFPIHVYITNLSKLGLGALRWVLSRDRIERRRWIYETFETLLPPAHQPADFELWLQGYVPNHFPDKHGEFMGEQERNIYQIYTLDSEVRQLGRTQDERDNITLDSLVREVRFRHNDRLEPDCPNLDDLCKLGWAFWDLQRLKQLGIITNESTESNIVCNFDLRARKSYQEQRDGDPYMPKLEPKVFTSIWERAFKPQTHTTPSNYEDPEELYRRLNPILQLAQNVQIEK
ncbi:hypothetical protein VP1G_04662 [Cytospora mali]|uniref:Uncharacterized protein n=1 Tax=Cytospora mali TaxID=578113 RepID=A0A194V0N2_CYTMA|nr:hypothetical protein VP1G_04662 [Valsa mali var. pyri (nom. inval.)]